VQIGTWRKKLEIQEKKRTEKEVYEVACSEEFRKSQRISSLNAKA